MKRLSARFADGLDSVALQFRAACWGRRGTRPQFKDHCQVQSGKSFDVFVGSPLTDQHAAISRLLILVHETPKSSDYPQVNTVAEAQLDAYANAPA